MKIAEKNFKFLLMFLINLFCFGFFALTVSAQTTEYQPLTGLPGVTDTDHVSLAAYVNALFLLSIALGALLAVIQITIGGFTYMMSDVVTKKGDAIDRITSSLLGLGILLATFVVLWTINPQLTNLNILSGAETIQLNILPPERSSGNGNANASSIESCATGEEFYVNTNGEGGCRTKSGSSTTGDDNLCPEGQHAIQATVVVGGEPADYFKPYPDGDGFYECVSD